MATVGALQVLFITQHALQALGMKKVTLAFAHLNNVNLFHVAVLLVLQLIDFRLSHILDALIELPVTD